MKTKDLIAEAVSLPIEERAMVLDSLLRSLNTPEPDIDTKWAELAQSRLQQLKSGEITPISSADVFKNSLLKLKS